MQHDDDDFMRELRFRVNVMREQKPPDLRGLLPPQLLRSAMRTNRRSTLFGKRE